MALTCKVIVAHPFQQHSFKTAAAILRANCLFRYVTTVYDKKGSWTRKAMFFLRGEDKERGGNRKSNELKNESVIQFCEIHGLLLLLLQRIDKKGFIYTKCYLSLLKRFNKKLVKYSIKNNIDAIIVYDVVSADYIQRIKKEKGFKVKIILDMSAPYYNYMVEQFHHDSELYNYDMNNGLNKPIYSYRNEYSRIELEGADAFFVASEFTKKSVLTYRKDAKVYICNYGVEDFANNTQSNVDCSVDKNHIHIVFVGAASFQKGAHHLINAINQINDNRIELSMYGTYDPNSSIFQQKRANVEFHGHVPREKMKDAYKNADILVVPSLADGYGFVIPEGLAYATAVVASKNAGASFLVKDGVNGYVFDPFDENALVGIIAKLINNTHLIEEMKKNAILSINNVTWESYNKQVKSALYDVLNLELDE